jgi:mannose-6-phosphate isomerase-like protein (cupin superfamily)
MKIVFAADRQFIPASHENPLAPGTWKKVLFQKEDFQPGRVQMVNWARMPSGHAFAPHYHEDMQEIFVIFQGTAEITVDGQSIALAPGDAILIDAHEVHRMRNTGADDVDYMAMGISAEAGGRTMVVEGSGPVER